MSLSSRFPPNTVCLYWTTPIVLLSLFECYKPFTVHWWLSVCLVHQFRMCICMCVYVTLTEWTITKNPLNSCCSLCLPPSVSTQSPNFTSRCSDTGFGCPSTSSLIPTCHFVRFNAGVSCHSCQCTAASYLTHFFHTTGAYVINALRLHFLSHFCLVSKVRGAKAQHKRDLCHFTTAEQVMVKTEMPKVCVTCSLKLKRKKFYFQMYKLVCTSSVRFNFYISRVSPEWWSACYRSKNTWTCCTVQV